MGDPQNAYIAIRFGIHFSTFTLLMMPLMLACLGIAILIAMIVSRRDLAAPVARQVPEAPLPSRDRP